jgi:hypothetical protein
MSLRHISTLLVRSSRSRQNLSLMPVEILGKFNGPGQDVVKPVVGTLSDFKWAPRRKDPGQHEPDKAESCCLAYKCYRLRWTRELCQFPFTGTGTCSLVRVFASLAQKA